MASPAPTPAIRPGDAGRRGLPRYLSLFALGNLALFATYAGVNSILLPVQVEHLDPANKETNLAIVSGVSAAFAALCNPLGGALSDRTRSRWGRRNPWLVGGALAALASLALLGSATAFWMLLIGWCAGQAFCNFYHAAITATIADRVVASRRGTASAMMGVANSAGMVVGSLAASRLVDRPEVGYVVFGVLLVVAALAFAGFTHDPRGDELTHRESGGGLAEQLKGFGLALRTPDFAWAFTSRALMVMGFYLVMSYTLYILGDYIAMPDGLAPTDAVPLLLFAASAMIVAFTSVTGPVSDRLGRRRVFVVIAGVVAAAATLVPVLWPAFPGMLVWALVGGAGFGVFMAVDHAIVTLVLPYQQDAARDLGILNVANAGPQIVAPFVSGVLVVATGSYMYLFVGGAVVSLAGAFAILKVKGVD